MEAGRRKVWALLGSSVVARLPLAMFSIALLVHARHLTGSFAAAGLVTGAYAGAVGVGGPLLGRLVDRRGQTRVLLASAAAAAALLCVIAELPRATPLLVVVALAIAVGVATPPVDACARGLLPELILDGDALRAAYAFESSALELTFIFGPPLALGLGALWSTGAALAAGGVLLLIATAAFALQRPSREWLPKRRHDVRPSALLRAPGMQTLFTVLAAVGVVFGAVEVGVTAAANALGGTAIAGPLLAVWGIGSLAGGLVASRLGGGARSGRGLALILTALAGGHLALGLVLAHTVFLACGLFVAGATIAPTYATVYSMVGDVAPGESVTEAFAWLSTAVAIGAAAGAAASGALADAAGTGAVFSLAGTAGAVAILLTLLRAATLLGAQRGRSPLTLRASAALHR
jgi:MFS family permease